MPASLNVALLYLFWGAIGAAILAPILFVTSIYQVSRTSSHYHFRGYYRMKREYYHKSARAYGWLVVLCMVLFGGLYKML